EDPQCRELMDPILKVGFVHTKEEDGFEVRKPQCAMKVAQPKLTVTKRGVRGKVKGKIVEQEPYENYFIVPAKGFVTFAQAIDRQVWQD
ncbi:MAG: hypothetical protein ACE5PO_01265, partial [Candidatus Bathyarchaeia archaeon]